ncbi:MAG: metallophosphoesterase, partial [Candidatus Micrarchaeota archaeon]|nr:metallophosphoesterase [Candidatus Micrarchaeota archaeon]
MARFAHIADCHLGAFRDPDLRERNLSAFEWAMAEATRQNLDFAIIAGDLFDISIPDLAVVQRAVRAMRAFARPIYAVYGSHDYSPTQTSVIDVLNEAGVLTKVS